MAVKKETTLDDFKPVAKGVEAFMHERTVRKENHDMDRSKPVLFSLAVAVSILLIIVVYFLFPDSKVKSVSVDGNRYLSKAYIEKLSGVTYDSRYFLVFPAVCANKVKEDPMIDDCRILARNGNVIQIQVREKRPLAYRVEARGPVLLLENGEKVPMNSEYMSIIARLPMVTGFEDEQQTYLLTKALASLNENMLEEISEIRQYEMKYDKEMLMLQMREGGYFFSSYFNLEALNHYHEIEYYSSNDQYCYYAESPQMVSGRECPWEAVPVVYDYWLDENGDPLINKYGDQAVKHYYKDENGNFYLDQDGNKIVIPINDKVEDMVDPDFKEHFMAGYYKTGKLELPTEEEKKKMEEEEKKAAEEEAARLAAEEEAARLAAEEEAARAAAEEDGCDALDDLECEDDDEEGELEY